MEQVVLTPKERQQLLAVLQELDRDVPPEKRREIRRKIRLKQWIQPIAKGKKSTLLAARLVNISRHGVGLLLTHSLPLKQKFLVPLRFREGGGWLVLCEVQNCASLEDGTYKIGGRFIDKIDDPKGNAKPPLDWML